MYQCFNSILQHDLVFVISWDYRNSLVAIFLATQIYFYEKNPSMFWVTDKSLDDISSPIYSKISPLFPSVKKKGNTEPIHEIFTSRKALIKLRLWHHKYIDISFYLTRKKTEFTLIELISN